MKKVRFPIPPGSRKFQCITCGRKKTCKFFHRDRTRRYGIHPECKECRSQRQSAYSRRTRPARNAYDRAWWASNKEYAREMHRKMRLRRRRRDPVAYLIKRAKAAAKWKGLAFNLRHCDLTIPERCPVLGMKLVWPRKLVRRRPANLPSIDRVNPRRGYVRGNVRVISFRANLLKRNATLDELKALVRYVEEAST